MEPHYSGQFADINVQRDVGVQRTLMNILGADNIRGRGQPSRWSRRWVGEWGSMM